MIGKHGSITDHPFRNKVIISGRQGEFELSGFLSRTGGYGVFLIEKRCHVRIGVDNGIRNRTFRREYNTFYKGVCKGLTGPEGCQKTGEKYYSAKPEKHGNQVVNRLI
jgi:hypothetical protein